MLVQFIVVITIAFAVVLFFLKKLLWTDTESAVNRLQSSYEEIKKQKSELDQKLLAAEAEYKAKKEESERIASEIVSKANEEASNVRDDAFKKAKEESDAIITKAHKSVEKIKSDIRLELEMQTVEMCGKLLRVLFSQDVLFQLHRAMIADFLKELATTDLSKIAAEFSTVDISTYLPLTDEERRVITEIVNKKLRREIALKEEADPALLCGLMVKFGGLALDGSLASRIRDAVIAQKQSLEENK